MKKLLLFTAALLCAASMWADDPIIEGPWTLVHYTTQEKEKIANDSITFNSGYSGQWWGPVDRVTDANGFGFNWTGISPANRMRGSFAIFAMQDAVVPPYTSMNVNWAFKLSSMRTQHYSTVCLYGVPCSSDSIQNLKVPFTNRFDEIEDKSTIKGLLAWYYNNTYSKNVESSDTLSATLSFDNSTGSTEQTKEWSMMMAFIVGSADNESTSNLDESGYFKSLHIDTTWTYFKIFTFDANGGEGSMDKDTIENSGNLTANTFTKDGYYFMGWADGAKVYDDGAEITATKEDKGLDTLYAVWQQIITSVPTPILGMVYNGEEKTLINAGTAVGGTMQYSLDNTNWSAELPKATNAGTYTVYYRVVGHDTHPDYTPENNTVTATIDKATPTYTTRPAAIRYLKANGGEQTLVTSGVVAEDGLSVIYKRGDSEYWTNTPSIATQAGNYYVYYKIDGDANHYDTKADTLIATIYPAESPVPADENYDASKISVLAVQEGANTEDPARNLFDGQRNTKWCSITNYIHAYSDRPKDIVVWRTEGFVKMVSYTLITGNDTQTYPNRNWSSWTLYGGKFESDNDVKSALLTEDGWTIIDNQIQDTVLKAFNDSCFQFACNTPGWYKYYRLVIHDIRRDSTPQDNIQQMAELTMGVTTFTPPTYVTRPSAKAYLKYSGNAQPLINAGSATNGATVVYKLENGEWTDTVPQATDSGNYYVYYKIQGTELYPESEPETLITTIYGNKTVPVHDNYPYGGISVLAKQEGSNTDGNQHADKLFNGDADSYNSYNKWCSVTTDIAKYEDRPKDIVVWKTAKAIEMISYELRIGNDAETYRNRNWYSWTIYGGEFDSDNAAKAALTTEEGWTIIDNQINDTVLKEVNDARYNFVCNNPGTYKYYRLVIHALHVTDSAANQSVQQMSELTMGIEHVVPVYQTRPSAKANLQYSGENQTLIEAGTPTTGTIKYKLEGDQDWSETLPQASAKGNYYVYYQIDGSEIAPDTLIATIYDDRTVPEHDDYSYSNISVLAKQEGSDTSDDQRADKLFNGNDQTGSSNKWCSESKGIAKYEDRPQDIVVWKTASDIEMISYQLKTGNDTQQYPNRNWYSWTIYGGTFANDAEATAAMLNEGAWTIIDNQIKDTLLEERNNVRYNFACNNPGTYQYYRLVIHALHVTDSAKTQGVQQMQELTMGIKKSPATGVEEAKANGKATKLLREGQLFIIREGKKYNAQGVEVR